MDFPFSTLKFLITAGNITGKQCYGRDHSIFSFKYFSSICLERQHKTCEDIWSLARKLNPTTPKYEATVPAIQLLALSPAGTEQILNI
jgi:hypothetical protein